MFTRLFFMFYKEALAFAPYFWACGPCPSDESEDESWDLIAQYHDGLQ